MSNKELNFNESPVKDPITKCSDLKDVTGYSENYLAYTYSNADACPICYANNWIKQDTDLICSSCGHLE